MDSVIADSVPPPVARAASVPAGSAAILSPEILLASLRRSALPIVGCALAGALLAYLYASGLEKSYTASSAVAVEGDRIAIPELQGALRADDSPDPMPLVHTEVQALSARQLIAKVADRLQLDRDPEFNASLRTPGLGARIKDWLKSFLPATKGGTAAQSAAQDSLLNAATHALVVSQDNRSLVIGIAFTAHDPALAARFVNTLVKTYIDERAQRRVSANSGANAAMTQRIDQVRADIDRIEKQMRSLRNSSGVVALRAGSVGQQQVEDLATAASRATLDRSQIEANWQRASALASGGSSDALASVLGSETISRLREQEAAASAHVADLSQRFGPNYPALRSAQADLSATRAQLGGETHRIVASLATQVRVARAHEADVLAQLAAARRAGVDAQNTEAELDQLQQDATTRRQLYRTLLERTQQTATQPQGSETPDVRVLSDAAAPGLPSAPNLKAAAGLGGVSGGLLAWGVAVAFLRRTGPLDGEGFARQAAVAVAARLRVKGARQAIAALLAAGRTGPEAGAMRQLRLHLERISRTAPRVVGFVGAQSGGLAAASAYAFARAAAWDGRRVLLIDMGAGDSSIRQVLRAPDGLLGNVLAGTADVSDAVRHDGPAGLDYLLGATRPATADASRRTIGLENLLAGSREDYDLVVLGIPKAGHADTAPLLRSLDAGVLVIDDRRAADRDALTACAALRAGSRLKLAAFLLAA